MMGERLLGGPPSGGPHAPPHGEQHQQMDEYFTAPVMVPRLLTPLKMPYEAVKTRAEPYTKIVESLAEMWCDTVELVKQAVGEKE